MRTKHFNNLINVFPTIGRDICLFTSGFTLLEVMVAIAILALSLTAVLKFQGTTLISSMRAERMTVAVFLARQKMVDAQLELEKAVRRGEFPEDRSEDGEFDEPFEEFKWKYEIRKVELPAPIVGEEGSMQEMVAQQLTKEISRSVRQIKVVISWREGLEERMVDIVTHWVKL